MLTLDQIKELMEIVVDRRLARFELERAGFRLRIDGVPPTPVVGAPAQVPAPSSEPLAAASAPSGPAEGEPASDGLHLIKSPIVGTFYAAPSPEADAFVGVGDRVSKGQVVCIVEAMKLMNEIEADQDGVVVEVLGRNGEPVEFGEPLFKIEAD